MARQFGFLAHVMPQYTTPELSKTLFKTLTTHDIALTHIGPSYGMILTVVKELSPTSTVLYFVRAASVAFVCNRMMARATTNHFKATIFELELCEARSVSCV